MTITSCGINTEQRSTLDAAAAAPAPGTSGYRMSLRPARTLTFVLRPPGLRHLVCGVADATHLARSKRAGIKSKATDELREWFVNAAYLALFLCTFAVYRALITRELLDTRVAVQFGASLVTALVIAKTIMIGGWLKLGESGRRGVPLIIRTMRLAAIYGVFVFFVTVLEKAIEGMIRGHAARETLQMLAHLGWEEITARSLVIFLAFIPYFALREFARRKGVDDTFDLLFRRDDR